MEYSNNLLQMKDVIKITGLSKSYLYLILNNKSKYYLVDFPKPFKVGLRKNFWDETAIYQWIEKTKLNQKEGAK